MRRIKDWIKDVELKKRSRLVNLRRKANIYFARVCLIKMAPIGLVR